MSWASTRGLEFPADLELAPEALELLSAELGLTGGCREVTCGFPSCWDRSCGYASGLGPIIN